MNKPLLIVLLMLLPVSVANACIWDRDTLAMERARFPEVNELIVGYFPRHSPVYYQWRLEQIKAIPVEQRTAADYDDLGASYDKLGQHDKAIQTMLDKIERFPDEGVYETHANLGTFYIHSGDLEQGVQYIGSAIEINPEAHFGREVYQKLLVEYLLQCDWFKNPTEDVSDRNYEYGPLKFHDFVLKDFEGDYEDKRNEIEKAIKGVLGMMRFGHHDSPILLAVLGDLLFFDRDHGGGQRLAAMAFLKASHESEHPIHQEAFRIIAEGAIQNQEGVELSDVEKLLKEEIVKGDAYFAKIVADEKAWIAAGKDVDAEFTNKYYDSSASFEATSSKKSGPGYFALAAIGMAIIVVIGVVASYIARTRNSSSVANP